MGCSSCSKKREKLFDKESIDSKVYQTISSQKPAIFDNWWGKILYFSLCLILCLTPIINLICLFLFAKLIFNNSKEKKVEVTEENVEINQDTHITE